MINNIINIPIFPPPKAYRAIAARLKNWLKACTLCPRLCRVNRLLGERGFCKAGLTAPVNIAQLHFGEELSISASRGSGTIFFAGCTLSCCFCQNYVISQAQPFSLAWGREMGPEDLASIFLELQLAGAHNLNLVTPTPHLVVILEALAIARDHGCYLPVIYNTSGYERVAVIRQIKGLIDIYMPDYKYADDREAQRLSGIANYIQHCRASLQEMFKQVGILKLDNKGEARRGVLVRHLVLPNRLSGTREVMHDIVRLGGRKVWVSLMSQYKPLYLASQIPGLERKLLLQEYNEALISLQEAGIEYGFIQNLDSANGEFMPNFIL